MHSYDIIEFLKKLFPWNALQQLLAQWQPKVWRPGLCCIQFDSEGIRCTYITRDIANKPLLEWCKFIPLDNKKDNKAILMQFVKEQGLHNIRCCLLLNFSDYKLLTLQSLPVPPNELATALRWRIKDMIDFPLNEAILDFFPAPGHGDGKTNLIHVVVARLNQLQTTLDLLQTCGFAVQIIDIPELALRNLTALFPEDEQGINLLWLHPTDSASIITQKAELYLMRHIEQPLAALFTAPEDQPPSPLLQKLLEGLTLEIHRSLDYYRSQLRQPNPVKVFLTCKHPILLNYLTEHLANSLAALQLQSVLHCKEPLSDELQTHCLGVIGGALRTETTNAATN